MMSKPAELSGNLTLTTIKKRRSVRSFTDQPVPELDLLTMLSAANRAPSAHNQQSWRFIVVRGEKKQALAELVNSRAADFPRPSCALLRMASRTILSAPVVVAVANTGELIRHGGDLFQVNKEMALDFFRLMEIQSSAAAVQNLLLAATSMGIGTVWLGILYLIKHEVLTFLEEPDGEFMAVIPVGYPSRVSEGPKKRPLAVSIRYLD
jgi:nitroreductase